MLRIVVVCALVLRCHVIVAAVSAIRCRTPLGPKNGRVIYSSFEYGAELEYECDEGFILQNYQPRICNEDGLWSNDEPECIETCEEEPPVIKNGKPREFAPVNGSVVEYECDKGYELEGHSSVQCAFGAWVGQPPVCNPSRCYLNNLKNAAYIDVAATDSVTLSGNTLVVVCKEGYSSKSEGPVCLNGNWSGDNTSPCKENGCVIPILHHGDIEELKLGDYCWSWKKFRYERETTYVKIPPGTILANDSAVMVFCHTPYSFQGTSTSNQEITCLNGHLLPDPSCLRARCHLKNLQNSAYVDVAAIDSITLSGNRLDVKCKEGYSLSSERPICLHAKWSRNYNSPCSPGNRDRIGSLPSKINDGCVIPMLHDGHIKKIKLGDFYWNWRTCRYERKPTYAKIPPGSILANGSAVMLFCHQTNSFQGTSRRNQGITCLNGDWFPEPVCLHSIHACQMNKDETSHLIVDPEKDYYRSGDSITLSCPPGQKLTSGVEKMMCVGSTWSNTLPDCIEMTEPNLARLTTTKSQ